MTTHTSGPGKRSRGSTARNTRKSATSGPLCPSSRRNRCQAEEGHCWASSSTVTLAELEGCRRSRRGTGPLCERVWGGTQLLGRWRCVCPSVWSNGQTFVSRGTSARYHNPCLGYLGHPFRKQRSLRRSGIVVGEVSKRAITGTLVLEWII